MGNDPLLFEPEEADVIFDELGALRVELDDDPLSFGPKRLNRKVSEVRRNLDRCEKLFLDVSQRMYATKRALRVISTEIDLAKKNLYANDPDTRAGKSVADREAIAAGKLLPSIHRMNHLQTSTLDLEAVLVVIKSKKGDLKDTESRLKDQMRLCQEEIGLNQAWGSRVDPLESAKALASMQPVPQDSAEISAIIDMVDSEVHLAQLSGEWVEPEPHTPADLLRGLAQRDPQEIHAFAMQKSKEIQGEVPVQSKGPILSAEEALPGTVSSAQADSFLRDFAPVPPSEPKKSGPAPAYLAPPSFLDDLLADFESAL